MIETNMNGYMEIKLDYQEKDLLIDCIQYRLYTDKILVINNSLKNEIEDLLAKVEEECV
jgi:CRISPR/Cas system CMR-associated protein Cmr5 small subunit